MLVEQKWLEAQRSPLRETEWNRGDCVQQDHKEVKFIWCFQLSLFHLTFLPVYRQRPWSCVDPDQSPEVYGQGWSCARAGPGSPHSFTAARSSAWRAALPHGAFPTHAHTVGGREVVKLGTQWSVSHTLGQSLQCSQPLQKLMSPASSAVTKDWLQNGAVWTHKAVVSYNRAGSPAALLCGGQTRGGRPVIRLEGGSLDLN